MIPIWTDRCQGTLCENAPWLESLVAKKLAVMQVTAVSQPLRKLGIIRRLT